VHLPLKNFPSKVTFSEHYSEKWFLQFGLSISEGTRIRKEIICASVAISQLSMSN
jgi:hypothetical protein